ncbi:ComEC/Rec2 family competence protein [Silvibacterium acidisoli]|uniref:ComEC/Rec2 family competence protein n=1 Tax=Acidobacteriaceae bacterium ZG23-2 TaxID=2883246 RepID=UPI00406CE04A
MKGLALGSLSLLPVAGARTEATTQEEQASRVSSRCLEPWTPGALDIHHISTGRGNVAFLVCPDRTTILIDAGALHAASDWGSDEKYRIQPLPDASLRPGQWIARYIARHMPAGRKPAIDYFILTHLHPDHMGGVDLLSHRKIMSRFGGYELTGVMDVHEEIPIRKILDRGYPDYSYPLPLVDPHQRNYRAFIASFLRNGGIVERFAAGSSNQIRLLHSGHGAHPDFIVQNLCANGRVWSGRGEDAEETFPSLDRLEKADYPTENKCSVAMRLAFGSFRYFSGGDMDHDTAYGRLPWGNIEARVARASGPVDVAMANHHGYVNACGPEWVAALRPRAFIISAWDSAHPTIPALDNMLSRQLYDQPRDVFSTALKPENIIATKRLHEIQSGSGHVIVRVAPGGDDFKIAITSNRDESDRIIAQFGPYHTTEKSLNS